VTEVLPVTEAEGCHITSVTEVLPVTEAEGCHSTSATSWVEIII